jgi:uncharacterized Zn-finger protein
LTKHTGAKPFHCTLCSARFNQKGNLRVHVEKTHTAPIPGVKMYKCSHCTCIFKKVASLNVHITKSHANNEDLGNISTVMSRLKELEEQTAVTPNMRPVEKEVAEQNKKVLDEIKEGSDVSSTSYVRLAESFLDGTVRRYLVMQRKVNDVRWYICSYCNKEFKKPSDLIRHTRVHTREKPFMVREVFDGGGLHPRLEKNQVLRGFMEGTLGSTSDVTKLEPSVHFYALHFVFVFSVNSAARRFPSSPRCSVT